VTCKALSIQSLTLPGLMAGSSRVSEIGEDFVEELDGVRLAQSLVEPSLPPTATQEVSGSHFFADFAVICHCPTDV
jgi:hypothetical protein